MYVRSSFAHVDCRSEDDQQQLISSFNGTYVDGRSLRVEAAKNSAAPTPTVREEDIQFRTNSQHGKLKTKKIRDFIPVLEMSFSKKK